MVINITTQVPTQSTQVSVSQFGSPVVTDLNNLAKLPNCMSINNQLGSGTLDQTTYANIAGTSSISFTKRYDSTQTKLLVWLNHGGRISALSTTIDGAIQIFGTDYQISRYAFSTSTAQNEQWGGHREITGIGAGTFTVQARHRRFFGSGILTTDNNSWFSLTVMEVPA